MLRYVIVSNDNERKNNGNVFIIKSLSKSLVNFEKYNDYCVLKWSILYSLFCILTNKL